MSLSRSERVLEAAALALAGGAVSVMAVLGAEAEIARHHPYLHTAPDGSSEVTAGAPDSPPLLVATVGDSLVAGVGAERFEETIPYRLAGILGADHRVTVRSFGVPGSRLRDVVREQVPALEGWCPDVLLVIVGANDVTHLSSRSRLRRELSELTAALDRLCPGTSVVVSSVPPYEAADSLPVPLRQCLGFRARQFTRLYRNALGPAGAFVYDASSIVVEPFHQHPDYMSIDRFHPSAVGYAYLAGVYARGIRLALDGAAASPDGLAEGMRRVREGAGRHLVAKLAGRPLDLLAEVGVRLGELRHPG